MHIIERHAQRFDGALVTDLSQQHRGKLADGAFLVLQGCDEGLDRGTSHIFDGSQQIACGDFPFIPPIRVAQRFQKNRRPNTAVWWKRILFARSAKQSFRLRGSGAGFHTQGIY